MMSEADIKIPFGDGDLSAIWNAPGKAKAGLVIAHGAGAGMRHRFLASVAEGLAVRDIATLRYQFPYMEAGRKSPGSPRPAIESVRYAVSRASELAPDLPLFAGGKSYGARMTSTAESVEHLSGVRGLVFFGFPLHPPGKQSTERATHLASVDVPMLFLQGTRDAFAEHQLIEQVCADLGSLATLTQFEGADHSFHVPKSVGSDATVMTAILDAVSAWIDELIASQ